MLIFVAAALIQVTSAQRFLHPAALEGVGIGLAISTLASALNTARWGSS